ncbi:MAG: hypothetical protein ACK5HY_17600 [Parahaliea sp.]
MKRIKAIKQAPAALLLSTVASVTAAQDGVHCGLGKEVHGGHYRIESSDGSPATLSLLREKNRVMQTFPELNRSELFQRNAQGSVHLTRYYDDAQRGVEFYQATSWEPRTTMTWDRVWQLLPEDQLSRHDPERVEEAPGCARVAHYRYRLNGRDYALDWLPDYHLLKRMEITGEDEHILWELTAVETNAGALAAQEDKRLRYLVVDFADISDQQDRFFLELRRDKERPPSHF